MSYNQLMSKLRGFALLSEEERVEMARKGGIAAHQQGKGHEFTPEEAKKAGRIGGLVTGLRRQKVLQDRR